MSIVQICNRGLTTYLGAGTITSLTDGSVEANQCSLHYQDELESLLEAHDWKFATGRQSLAAVENDRETEWAYKYATPAESLFVRWVNVPATARLCIENGEDPDTSREMIDGFIYSDVQFAVCEFTKNVSDSSRYPSYFREALSAMMAARIALSVTESNTIATRASRAAQGKFEAAVARDEQQMPAKPYRTMPDALKVRGL